MPSSASVFITLSTSPIVSGIERRGRLVEQHQRRLHGERAGDRDALLLSAGERGGMTFGLVREADLVEQRVGPRFGRGRVELQHRDRARW